MVHPFTAIVGQQPGAEHSCHDARFAPDLAFGHQRPRSTGSIHPDRISLVRNVAIPLWSGRKSSRPDDLRKEGGTPQRGHDCPRSDSRLPKGARIHLNDNYEIAPLETGRVGGLARVATLIKQLKKGNKGQLELDVNATEFLDYLSPRRATATGGEPSIRGA
jgi:hypothetical protein